MQVQVGVACFYVRYVFWSARGEEGYEMMAKRNEATMADDADADDDDADGGIGKCKSSCWREQKQQQQQLLRESFFGLLSLCMYVHGLHSKYSIHSVSYGPR
jgi:hypothetical protein